MSVKVTATRKYLTLYNSVHRTILYTCTITMGEDLVQIVLNKLTLEHPHSSTMSIFEQLYFMQILGNEHDKARL